MIECFFFLIKNEIEQAERTRRKVWIKKIYLIDRFYDCVSRSYTFIGNINRNYINTGKVKTTPRSIGSSVVECSLATRAPRVRFPADARGKR